MDQQILDGDVWSHGVGDSVFSVDSCYSFRQTLKAVVLFFCLRKHWTLAKKILFIKKRGLLLILEKSIYCNIIIIIIIIKGIGPPTLKTWLSSTSSALNNCYIVSRYKGWFWPAWTARPERRARSNSCRGSEGRDWRSWKVWTYWRKGTRRYVHRTCISVKEKKRKGRVFI